jgi:tetratricopeptide (TPR) repeat protein
MIAVRVWLIAAVFACLVSGCGESKRELAPVPVPDLSLAEPSVRSALVRARTQFDGIAARKPSDAELANAYGDLAMSYQAHSFVAPAEAAYRNARALAPREKRWPYLQGHLYNDAGSMAEAINAFEAASSIDGEDGPILFSLAEVSLQHGDLDKAQALFEKFQSKGDEQAAALAGLGKVALAKHQFAVAIERLEQALRLSPDSSRLRQPLAMAYKGIGDGKKAEQNLAQYAVDGLEPAIADPAVEAMGSKVASARALFKRGQRAIEAQRFDLAEASFRTGREVDSKNAAALAYLVFSLANRGRSEDVQRPLLESLEIDDTNALAHFSLGVVYDRQGQDARASEQYEAALKYHPQNTQALVYLADAKMRMGLPGAAAELYRQVLHQSSDSASIQMSLAMASVKARRFGEARKALEAALAAQPRNPAIANALARLLATAPDNSVRDGARAAQMAKALFESTQHPEVGQTYAMALAETGKFDEAVKLQQETISVVDPKGANFMKPFLARNLALYRQRKPAREGWAVDDPAFQPRSPAVSLAKAAPTS